MKIRIIVSHVERFLKCLIHLLIHYTSALDIWKNLLHTSVIMKSKEEYLYPLESSYCT